MNGLKWHMMKVMTYDDIDQLHFIKKKTLITDTVRLTKFLI